MSGTAFNIARMLLYIFVGILSFTNAQGKEIFYFLCPRRCPVIQLLNVFFLYNVSELFLWGCPGFFCKPDWISLECLC